MSESNSFREAAANDLTACVDAWNAKQRAINDAEAAKKAARRADPKAMAQAERARAYRERNKERLAAKAVERRERDRLAQQAAHDALFGPPIDLRAFE